MSSLRPLNLADHGSLRFDPTVVGPAHRIVQIGLSEVPLVAADMPVCFAKDGTTGKFNLVALVGLVDPANLFVQDRRFHATYCPRALQLTGFRLDVRGVAGLAVDESDPAIGGTGDSLFRNGEPTSLAAGVAAALERLVADIGAARAMAEGYAALRLIQPMHLVLQDEHGKDEVIDGLYTIGTAALAQLGDVDVLRLHRSGALASAVLAAASLAQVERLCQLHNARGGGRLRIARLVDDAAFQAF